MKRASPDSRRHACTRKRKYPSQGHALQAAMLAGVERNRVAYLCAHCGQWHLASK